MLNQVTLIGRLTRDPEVKYTQNSTAVAGFTLACDRPFTNSEGQHEADFIPIVVWRKQAENCGKYISKGSVVCIVGRIQIRNYEGQDGQKRYVTEVVADNVRFLPNGGQTSNSSHIPVEDNTTQPVQRQEFQAIEEDGDELPF